MVTPRFTRRTPTGAESLFRTRRRFVPFTIARIEHGFNVRPYLVAVDNNVNPRNYLGKLWLDSLVHDPDALKYIVVLAGRDKIALGSDYPLPLGEHHPGKLIENTFADDSELMDKLLWKS